VWSAEQTLAQELLSLSQPQQARRIAAALDYRLGEVELVTELKAFPLVARHSLNYLQPRVALIGDAAHTLHPLAGQGVNLGLLDALELAMQIHRIKTAGKDLGDIRRLRPFERRRKGHNHFIQKSMTALNWIYGQQSPGWVLARNWGVKQLNRITPIKSQLIREAMGLSYDIAAVSPTVDSPYTAKV
jgi:2-polyprenyl-6-methoxyphenol hydroxylase-like FAD-dependent oxidoreductase